ncbi:MAG TPA: glycosyltransferase, partial [Gemmatimonadaceae bacterium]|nr:glycosyltransferase [Gemmatimonadaceae bacterium]
KRAERLGPWAGAALVKMARSVTAKWAGPVYRLRERLGLPRGADPVLDGQHSPRMVLALFSRLLAEPQPDWPPAVRITGPLFYDAAHGSALSPELERFLDRGDPPIVFTLGTSAVLASGDFYEQSAAAVRRLGRRAVLLAGDRAPGLGGTADVLALAAAPHSLLFPRAAAVVQQCGIGTLGQAMRAGRPTLCVPFAHDQPDNAHRLTRLGGARTLYPRRYKAPRVTTELAALLDDPSYARRASEIAAVVRTERGVDAACDAIEEVLGASRPSARTAS